MTNEMAVFDYAHYFSEAETDMLKTAEIEIKTHLDMAGQHLIEVGNRLISVKEELAEKGEGFVAWCNSDRFPLSHRRATEYMAVSRELGNKRPDAYLGNLGPGRTAIARLATMKDEDIRAALLDHIEEETEQGHNVTRKEVDALKKALKDERERAEEAGEQAFDAKAALAEAITAKEKAEAEAAEKAATIKRATDIAMESDKAKREASKAATERYQKLQSSYNDLAEVHREEIKEIEDRIRREERNRPRTNAEEDAHRAAVKALEVEQDEAQLKLNELNKDLDKAKQEAESARNSALLREEIEGKFASALNDLERAAGAMAVSSGQLGMIPITTEMHDKMSLVASLLHGCLENLEAARSVDR